MTNASGSYNDSNEFIRYAKLITEFLVGLTTYWAQEQPFYYIMARYRLP